MKYKNTNVYVNFIRNEWRQLTRNSERKNSYVERMMHWELSKGLVSKRLIKAVSWNQVVIHKIQRISTMGYWDLSKRSNPGIVLSWIKRRLVVSFLSLLLISLFSQYNKTIIIYVEGNIMIKTTFLRQYLYNLTVSKN